MHLRLCLLPFLGIYHVNGNGITRQDIYILPWNLEEAEVDKETPKNTDGALSLITHQAKGLEI